MGARLDDALGCLARYPRRVVVDSLRERESVPVAELTEQFPDDTSETRVTLVHTHLPRLADNGYVDWDRDAGTVSRGPRYSELEPLVTALVGASENSPFEWP